MLTARHAKRRRSPLVSRLLARLKRPGMRTTTRTSCLRSANSISETTSPNITDMRSPRRTSTDQCHKGFHVVIQYIVETTVEHRNRIVTSMCELAGLSLPGQEVAKRLHRHCAIGLARWCVWKFMEAA